MKKRQKRERKKQDRGIVDFMMVTNHFFHSLRQWILEMEENFNKETCIDTLRIMSENPHLEEMPHYDTLNYYLEKLSPECLSDLRKKMVTSLIRGKQFNRNRLLGKYWRVILDGTGLFYFKKKHCENCLCTTRKTDDGKTTKLYYHKVLEAKIVLSDNIVISLGTEFIKNKKENVSKQDYELNAAKRLLEKIKKDYPRLPICIQGDALYANQKNGLYRIEHLNSKNSNAMKNHYLLTQISDILMQLYLAWNPYVKELKQTIKNTSSELLESFRRLTVTEEDVSYISRLF